MQRSWWGTVLFLILILSLPFGGVHMPFAACANEPEGPDFEWDRLSELQRRNTMYLPHLKSAYPVEMQTVETEKLSDEGLRLSTVANQAKEKVIKLFTTSLFLLLMGIHRRTGDSLI